jgi:hypothetical protein
MDVSRRAFLAGALSVTAGLIPAPWAAAKPTVTVYKPPT